MTFEEAHKLLLLKLDSIYAELRKLHEDENYLNNGGADYQSVTGRFKEVQNDIFNLKNVWREALDLTGD